MRFLAATILGLMAFAAGGGATAAAAQLPPAHDFALAYERSGGLAASTQSLRVSPGGVSIAESSGARAGRQRVEFRIGVGRIRSLERGLRQADLDSIGGRQGGCADCYLYSITYEGTSVEVEETEVPPRLRPVIDEIEAVITAHVIPPNARAGRA